MRIAITANGPGEFAGWVRPLVAALRARDPSIEIDVICVPDDFATGREAAYVEQLFPGDEHVQGERLVRGRRR